MSIPASPVDAATLDLLWSAIHPEPEAERSSVFAVLDLYAEMAGAAEDEGYHTNDVIDSLIREVRRLRAEGWAQLRALVDDAIPLIAMLRGRQAAADAWLERVRGER